MQSKPILAAMMVATSPFAWASPTLSPQQALSQAKSHLTASLAELNLAAKDVADSKLLSQYQTAHNGVSHLVFRQYVNGIEVAGGDIQINLNREGEVLNKHNFFIKNAAQKANDLNPDMPADQAILTAASYLSMNGLMPSYQLEQAVGINQASVYAGDGISLQNIPVKLVYQANQQGQLKLAWDMSIQTENDWWSMRLDADTGEVLSQHNWSAHASYDVIPYPNESPADNGFVLETVTDPHDLLASPFGWHDTDGNEGAEFTDTRGNNVFAQDDLDANNTGGSRPDGGSDLIFSVPWNPAVNPNQEQNLDAAIVNLFYWNNIIHDLAYQYGFDEPAGNFQENNYGNGGSASDAVIADAQDGSGTNNANFGTPPDGGNPRMQMFYFTGSADLVINSPASIAGTYTASGASFGAEITPAPFNGIVELADDGVDTGSDACTALSGFTAGRIALVDRGACEFGLKALNAENAGAIGVVVVNNDGDGVISMGGGAQGGNVTIPALMVGQADGNTIRAELANVVDADMVKVSADRDSDFDNGIIIHEYGHGISNRLTGGPAQAGCLGNAEQMGEGWSDFFALMMTASPTDSATDARPMGSYATQNPNGIRTYPYSTDEAINQHSFADVVDAIRDDGSISPHLVGSIWAQVLWEMYWNLIEKHGFDADLYNGVGGNNIAMQLMMDGLKLQPCNPGLVSGRDAILLADETNNEGANQCEIWAGFAKRGLGVDADSGSVFQLGDEIESYDLPESCLVDSDLIFADSFE
ncbi:M36 family metallopeptidase [Marinicella sp. S1101]|uniref:M36 family metallopeptidase n=1 Tax=Marinicella marina TaxID=2996016 RepID=UPI002260EBE4|nr:M36 family metallopeptidase [Marinicella marina]MCX7553754.1 M36 family metallopeptidase [Marinicella marina]MDJ1140829.1 M36 family metallopeptidase [Marinicella marina]